MTQLVTALAKYRAYHRDARNVATHMLGIPMIFVAVVALLSRPTFELGGITASPAVIAAIAAALFYVQLDAMLGLIMAVFLALALWAGMVLAAQPTLLWLGLASAMFVVGWILQFIGHYFEGRKPAFVDDIKSLLIGPLFVVAEWVFALGLRRELRDAVASGSVTSG